MIVAAEGPLRQSRGTAPAGSRSAAIELRAAAPGETAAFLRPTALGFGRDVDPGWAGRLENVLDPERVHVAYDGDLIVGTAGSFGFKLSVPGGAVRAAGVTAVAVLPTYRRRGILRRLIEAQLRDLRSRREPVAVLWTSEAQIYGRFGYGLASLQAAIEIETTHAAFRDRVGDDGTIRIVDLDEAAEILPLVYDRVSAATPGMFGRSREWWRCRRLADPPQVSGAEGKLTVAVLEGESGIPEGYALYRLAVNSEHSILSGTLQALEVTSPTWRGTQRLWSYLFGYDLTHRVRAEHLPVDHPLVLGLSDPRRLRLGVSDGLWCRLVDVEVALASRGRTGDDTIVLEVDDAFLPENTARWRIDAAGVERTTAAPDITIAAADLASVYLGGFTFADLGRAGRIIEHRAGGRVGADRLFSSHVKPWCPEVF